MYTFSNFLTDPTNPFLTLRDIPVLSIGAAMDHKSPVANPISDAKAWASGEYNLVIIYKNITHNKTTTRTVPFMVEYK